MGSLTLLMIAIIVGSGGVIFALALALEHEAPHVEPHGELSPPPTWWNN